MAFKFYLDGQLTDQPNNDTDLMTSIKRDNQLKGLLITQDAEVIWAKNNDLATGEICGYDYIKSVFDTSICNEIELKIYDEINSLETYLAYVGIIKIPQVIFDEQQLSLKTKVQDNSYYSYINNNKDIKVDLRATQTKSKINLTPINRYQVDMFLSLSGVYGSTVGIYCRGYRIYDVLSFIVSAITDNKVSFASTYLSTLANELMIFKGDSLISPYTLFPSAPDPVFEISFIDIFNELDKIKNLYYYIDNSDPDNPVLRMENTEAAYGGDTIYTFSDIKELSTSIDSSKLYSDVRVGSDNIAPGQTANIYTFEESTSYYGWKIEQFFPLGQCNVTTQLNLVNSWVLSNNAIMECLVGGSSSYSDNYFLVEVNAIDTTLFTATAKQYDFFGEPTPPFYYNFGLNNYNKLQRHSDKFETVFGTFLGIGGNGFRALLGDDGTSNVTYMTGSVLNPNFIPPAGLFVDAEYVNETTQGGFDGNNNYNNTTTFEYTVPSDGDYSFHHALSFETEGLVGGVDFFSVTVYVDVYDAGMTLKASGQYSNVYYYDGEFNIDATLVASCLTTDIVKGKFYVSYSPNQAGQQNIARLFTVLWDSYLECNGTPEGGVSITAGNRSIKKLLHTFDYDINETDFRTIKANPTGLCYFEKDGVTRNGWIEDMQRNDWTGRTKVKLISNATS